LFSGLGQDYSGTIPAGQVGFWCPHGTANSFDNFYIHDLAGPFEIDGRWFGNSGDIQVDSGNNNVLAFVGCGRTRPTIRSHVNCVTSAPPATPTTLATATG